MRVPSISKSLLLGMACLLTPGGALAAQLKGYWEFSSPASGGAFPGVAINNSAAPNLVIEGTAPTYRTSLADDASPTPVTTLNGVITTASGVANRLKLTHGITPNGGSATLVNKYTLMFDVFSPTASRGQWRCFYQTNPANTDDGEFFIRKSGTAETLGIAEIGYSSTTMSPGKWHRVVISVDLGTSVVSYVDGVLLKSHSASTLNSHFALQSSVLLFGDNDGENFPMNVGAIAIWDGALTAAEAAALGKAGVAVSTAPPANHAPVISQGASTSMNVLVNGSTATTLSATDSDGNPISWTVSSAASHGSAQVTGSNTTCAVNYTPTPGYSGTDSFVVRASDGTDSSSITVYVLATASSATPQLTGLWEFNNPANRNQATIGFDLEPVGSGISPVTGIDGSDGAVEVAIGSSFKVTHGVPANGPTSATRANRYSLVWDVKIPAASAAIYKNLLQTTLSNNDDGDLFINPTNNIGTTAGLGGYSASALSAGTWNRIVLTVDNGTSRNVWVNGTKVLTGSVVGTADEARYGLLGQILAFADNDGEDGAIDVSSMAAFNGVLSDSQIALLAGAGTPVDAALPPKPAPSALWQFDQPTRPEAPTLGGRRLVRNGTSFTPVAGTSAGDGAMELGVGSNYLVNHELAANGGGSRVNEYSILWDVRYPTNGSTKSFYQTSLANDDDADLFVNASGNLGHAGLGGYSAQATTTNTWYRVVMVVKNGTDRSLYVDGNLWFDGNAGVVDDSYALDPAGFLAFADNDGGDGIMDVTNLALWGRALTRGEVLVLGSPSVAPADGITPVAPNAAPVITEGDTYTFNATKNGGAVSGVIHATDADNEPLVWSAGTAAHGLAVANGNGTSCTVSYTPASGFSGLDSFTVQVTDGWVTDTIAFDVTVTNPFADPVLTIVSPFGAPSPAAGTYPHPRGTVLDNSVADEAGATSRRHCIGWSMVGDGPHSGTAATMSMTLTRDSTLTWLWQTEYRVEMSVSGNGTLSQSSGWFEAGRPIQITATPAAGQYFAGWTGDTTGCTLGGKSIVVPMNRAYNTITARFQPVENFTVVGLPDTQNYCTTSNSGLGIYNKQTQWTIDNMQTLNIKFLTHLGDIVDSATNTAQWNVATAAMGKLDNQLPYGVCTGNHDLANGSTHYLDRFGPTHPRWVDPATNQVYDWYQGASPRGYSSYQVITVNGRDYMFLHIDCDCPDSDMAWAATVLSQHPRTVTMLTTHDYLAETGAASSSGSGTGQRGRVNWPTGYISVGPDRNNVTDIWNTLVKPFNQVYMVICGHNFAQYNIEDTNAAGKTVHQVIADYQTLPNGGNGFLRIMEFRPSSNQIYNTTYSPHLGRYMSNTGSPSAQLTSDNTGMLDLTNKNGGEFSLTTDFDTRFNHNLTIVSAQPTVSPVVGTTSVEEGTPVVVNASDRVVGTTRYKCTGWSLTGSQTAAGAGKTASFTMGGDVSLTWNWATEFYLDTQATGRGIVSVNSGYQAEGATVTLIAQPDGGASFLRWSGDIAGCTVNGTSISVPMTRGRGPVTAEFTPLVPTYNVLVVSDYPGASPAPASYPFEEGSIATFSAEDYTVGSVRHLCTGWTATGAVNQSGNGKSVQLPVSGNFTFTWQWKTQYQLQTAVSGPGSVTGDGQWIDENTSFQVTATAGSGAAFSHWTGDTGIGTASANVFTIAAMSRAVGPLTANFATGYHNLTVVSSQPNTLPAPGTYSYPHGSVIAFSAKPVENGRSRFIPAEWTLGSGTTGSTQSGSFTLNADTVLTWNWTPQVVLELAGGSEGAILPTDAGGWRGLGETVILHARPAQDFNFAAWRGDVGTTPSSGDLTLLLDQPRTVSADFKAIQAPAGTPKWWLERHSRLTAGDLAAAESGDADGDGKTAAEEFIAGMDDLDGGRIFEVKELHRMPGPQASLSLTWPGASGRKYSIWSTPDLRTPFTLFRDNIPSTEPFTTVEVPVSNAGKSFFKVAASLVPGGLLDQDPPATAGEPKAGSLVREMKLIPAGTFTMGDDQGGEQSAMPQHQVQVAAFFMDKFEVTVADWKKVASWAGAHGYDLPVELNFSPPPNHPAPGISWYEAVKWCNARSEMEGRVPAYYTDSSTTAVYRTGIRDLIAANVNWAGNGYRLPTEAEWERASRGGLEGKVYPWGNESLVGRTNGWQYQQAIDNTEAPYPLSTPVGYFDGHQAVAGPDMANGFGLYDMSGNAWEWCWDRYSDYEKPKAFDPKGPDTGDTRLTRGGSWWNNEADMTNAHRYPFPPVGENIYGQIGFRTMRSASPNELPH